MIRNGEGRWRRWAAVLMTAALLMTTCFTAAMAENIWDDLTINILWTDQHGEVQTVPAQPVPPAFTPDRAYWISIDPAAMNQALTVEAVSPNPAYAFYMEDELGGHTTSFLWTDEMDAQSLGYEYAYTLHFTVNGVQADMPILLYVSSLPMPEEERFESFPVKVMVNYVNEEGYLLDSHAVECWAGETTPVWASSGKTAGYTLMGADMAEVYVDQSGKASPPEVTFRYQKTEAPTEAPTEQPTPVAQVSVPVAYYHVNGDTLDFQEIFLAPGVHVVRPDSARTGGYLLVGDAAVTVTVYPDGSLEPASVVFRYEDAAPQEAVIPVYYYLDGELVDLQELTLTPGRYTIQPNSSRTEGMMLESDAKVEIVIFDDGSPSAPQVTFRYTAPKAAPAEAEVTVNYIHIDRGLLDSRTIILPEGVHTVKADSDRVGDYLPLGNTSAEVTVYADGSTHPGTVDFYYEDGYTAPVNAYLNIRYQLEDGTLIAQEGMTLLPGEHTILPDSSMTEGYELIAGQSAAVWVDDQGKISPETVTFLCRKQGVTVTVYYQDDRGRRVAPEQTYTYTSDGRYVLHAEPEGLSDQYEPAPGMQTQAEVTVRNGVATPQEVFFYYQQKASAPARVNVAVHYYDTYGDEIMPAQNVSLEPGVHRLTSETTILGGEYELVSDAAITVEVYENGTFSPQEVAFYYRKAQAEEQRATVTVHYRDDRGNEVAPSQTLRLGDGTHTIHAEPENLPAGYVPFDGTEAQVTVTVRGGAASQAQVVFYYRKTAVTGTKFTLPVLYYDTLGNPIASTQYVQIAAGTYNIQANPVDLPDGYELMMEAVQTVVVREDGTTDPEEIAFYYRAPAKRATVTVTYKDEAGRSIAPSFTVELEQGKHTIQAEASRVPSGYDPQSARPVQVQVSREGTANPPEVTLTFSRLVYETPIPVGENVYRYATVKGDKVAFRDNPTTAKNSTVLKRLSKGSRVYVLKEFYNDANEIWAMVNLDGRIGYVSSQYLDVMTQQKSDAYGAGNTPVPTFTPAPTFTPVPPSLPPEAPTATPTQALIEALTPPPAHTPTLEPLPQEPGGPTASPSPAPYTGYALTTRTTALRTGISASDMTIIQSMEANELVTVIDQRPDAATGEMWSIVYTLNKQAGFVQSSALRTITDKEAEPYLLYWAEINKTPGPTQLVTATPEPMQVQGYGVVLGNEVPFRQMASEYSRIIDNLDAGTIVYITGQTPADGQYWHSVNHEGYWGYIRADLVRMLTIAEEEDYLDRLNSTPTPEPITTNRPFDQNGMSSYGYVECSDGSSVNWRESPSTNANRVGSLKRYAFCLVLGSEYVNGTTWYEVRYGEKTGYLHGDFFRQMTIAELNDFLGSEEYLQGIANNSPSGNASMDDVGFTGTGGLVSAEDQWVNRNPDVYVSYAPFNPISTVAPIQPTPTLAPLPGWVTTAPTATPSPTPTFNPLPNVTYPTNSDGQGGSGIVWVVVIGLLLLAVGGVFALVRHQQNRRRIAMRAAQRRAQAARAQAMQQRPYARTNGQPQPRTGAYPNQQTQVRRPVQGSEAGQYAPYAGPYAPSGYRRADAEAEQPQPQRVGRRTAYRQAQREKENNSLDV